MATQPVLFMPHGGGPCFFMAWNPPHLWDNMAAYLRGIPASLPARPRAMVVISAHWEERVFTVQATPAPSLIYDYSGFPPSTYQITYPASGAPDLAQQVEELLSSSGIDCARDATRGFDHGVFIPLKVAFPEADIPIIQLSLKRGLDPVAHLALGAALRPLRDEGVLIVGSGMTYHNLPDFFEGPNSRTEAQSQAFDVWLRDAVALTDSRARHAALTHWEHAPFARTAHPREEHLIPLLVAAGAAGDDAGQQSYCENLGGIWLSGYRFG